MISTKKRSFDIESLVNDRDQSPFSEESNRKSLVSTAKGSTVPTDFSISNLSASEDSVQQNYASSSIDSNKTSCSPLVSSANQNRFLNSSSPPNTSAFQKFEKNRSLQSIINDQPTSLSPSVVSSIPSHSSSSHFANIASLTSLYSIPRNLNCNITRPVSPIPSPQQVMANDPVFSAPSTLGSSGLSGSLIQVAPTASSQNSNNSAKPMIPPSLLPFLPPSLAALSFPQTNWCAKCNATFRMTSDLVYHMRSHHKKENSDPLKKKREDKLRCTICGETFRERHHLTRHMTSHQ
ncbi:uncharacterized protein LOC141855347 [Brevipalpus obovatus]|uniref:uncharacterized protein LOC141855347 n=1 Tax=Brevipalpus obovatus TaxID=246614 RepID=UPI003D9DCEEB